SIGLELVVNAAFEMFVFSVPSCVNRKPVIESQWSNRQIEAKPEPEVRGEAIESAPRGDWPSEEDSTRLRIHAPWHCNCLRSEIPVIGVEEFAIVIDGSTAL